jgi:hypothetical protein
MNEIQFIKRMFISTRKQEPWLVKNKKKTALTENSLYNVLFLLVTWPQCIEAKPATSRQTQAHLGDIL